MRGLALGVRIGLGPHGNGAGSTPTPTPTPAAGLYGINISPSYQRMYVNTLAREYWLGDPYLGNPYIPMPYPYVNGSGELASIPPGISSGLMAIPNPGPGTAAWYRLTFTGGGDGSALTLSANPVVIASTPTRVDGHTIEFYLDIPEDLVDPSIGCTVTVTGTLATPIADLDCREITGPGGTVIHFGTFHPDFIERLQTNGDYFRTLDVQGINSNAMLSARSSDSWADRMLSRRALGNRSAALLTGTGTSRLLLTLKPYPETTAEATEMATRMTAGNLHMGTNGNLLSLTILAASGAGSVALAANGYDITVTPATGATTAAHIKAQLDAAPALANMMLLVTSGTNSGPTGSDAASGDASGAVGTLAKTNFGGGFDGAAGGYWPDIIELCNLVGKTGAWCHLDYNANADYAAGLAALLNSTLDTDLREGFTLEGDNEHWNTFKAKTFWIWANAIKNGRTGDQSSKMTQEYTARFLTTFDALLDVAPWVITTLGSFTSNVPTTQRIVDAAGFSSDIVKRIAVAMYYLPDGTLGDAFDDEYFDGAMASARDMPATFLEHKAIADLAGVEMGVYEGGQHDHLESNGTIANRRRRDDRSGLVLNFALSEYARLADIGVTIPFTFFNDYSSTGLDISGQWGLWEFPGQAPTPKSIAWFDARAGRWHPYFLPGSNPTINGTRAEGEVLTLNIPTAYRTDTITVQKTRDGTPFDSPIVLTPSDPDPTHLQTSDDIGAVVSGTIELANADYTTEYAFPDGPETEAAAPPFTLASLAGLEDWWIATSGVATSGSNVTGWTGTENATVMTVPNVPPTFGTVDGYSAVSFPNFAWLDMHTNIGTSDYTFLFVGKLNSGTSGDQPLIGTTDAGGPTVDTEGTRIRILKQNVAVVGSVTTGIDTTARFIIVVRYNATSGLWSIRVNGVEVQSGTSLTAFVSSALQLAFNGSTFNNFHGAIHAVGVSSAYEGEAVTRQWEEYAAGLLGITLDG